MPDFTSSRWHVLWPYLDRALDLTAAKRCAFVADLHQIDPELADDLQTLLDERSAISHEGFLDAPLTDQPEVSLAGQRIGAYTLISPIGRGGMGTVWLAERSDGRFTGKVAIKLLNLGLLGRDVEARFRREGSILARLTHENIAHLVDAGVSSMKQPYLVLEHVEGQHIDEYCDRHALGIEARLRLFLDVLDAVAHAHAHLIVHRDIKPSNVLVRTDGRVKLLDFGIAKLLGCEDDSTAVTAGVQPLTPAYAAPEQVTGGRITTATDVFALGVLLSVLLGGPRPTRAHGQSAAEFFDMDSRRLSDVAPNGKALRGDLDTIVAKALKKDPCERYASVSAFADDLRAHLRHEPVSARPDTVAYRLTKFVRRRSAVVSATACVAVVIACLVGFYTTRLASERDRARLEAQKSATVSELLISLLTAADPYASDREPTVRSILDAGAERVSKDLRDQPALKAEMLTVIGRVYQRLGLYEKASPLLEEAVKIGRARREETTEFAQSLNDLGVLRRERGDLSEATTMLEDALAIRRARLGRENKDVAITLVELGRAYEDRHMDARAEALFRESLDIREKVFGDAHRETATSKSALALVLWGRGDLAQAEPLFRQSLATSRAVLSKDHPNVSSGLNNLGLVLLDKGDYAGAEPMFRESLAIKRKNLGGHHPSLGPTLSNLAAVLREQGNFDEARSLLEEALAVTRRSLGDNHQSIAGFEVNLARVYLAQGDPAAAEHLLRDALGRQEQTCAPDDWRLAATRSTLGASLIEQGDYVGAQPLLVAASQVLKDVPGRQGKEAAATRARLTTLYKVLGG